MRQLDEQKEINSNIFQILKSLQKKQDDILKEGSSGNISEKLKSQTVAFNRNKDNNGGPSRLEGSLNNEFE